MPDISGFTQFVNENELIHSVHIISELLEVLLDSNTIGLKLAEIEGDALFMYTEDLPSFEALMNQVEVMEENFHRHIQRYENLRICNCGSCRTTVDLKLKFVVHYGDLVFLKVKDFVKPYSQDVIKAHRLLKNKIPHKEYILLTDAVSSLFKEKSEDANWINTSQIFDEKEVAYSYKDISSFGNIKRLPNPAKSEEFSAKTADLTFCEVFDTDMNTLYKYVSELNYRMQWDKNIKQLKYDESRVNRIGTEHNCILKFGNLKFETVSSPSAEGLIYGEKTKSLILIKSYTFLIKMIPKEENRTTLEAEIFVEYTWTGRIIKKFITNLLTNMWKNKLIQLSYLVNKENPLKENSPLIN